MLRTICPPCIARRRREEFLVLLITLTTLCAASLAWPGPCRADNRFWANFFGGAFGTPGVFSFNWATTNGGAAGATVPSTNDFANFAIDNTYTVTFAQNVTNQKLIVPDGDVTFDLNGRIHLLTDPVLGYGVRIIGGKLTISDGTLDVDETGLDIRVNGNGIDSGSLTVTTGGRIGVGATKPDVWVGNSEFGLLAVESNAQVHANELTVGNQSSGSGLATLTGSSAVVIVDSETKVGSNNGSTLRVTSGADLNADLFTLAWFPNEVGIVSVTGAGSTISTSGLRVGLHGRGSFIVQSGGVVTSSATSHVGANVGSQGDAVVTGSGSAWNITGNLLLAGQTGDAINGTISIDNGATVGLTGTGTLVLWANGTVNINDGTLSMAAFDFRGGDVNFNAGTIRFTGSTSLGNTDLAALLGADRTLKHARTLSVAGTAMLQGALVVDGGTFAVGTLVNQGGLVLRSGTLHITGVGGLSLGGAGVPTLPVPFGARLNVTQNLSLFDGAHLIVQGGEVTTGELTNLIGGRITLDGATSRLAVSGTLTNSGVLTGHGIVAARLHNHADGDVRPAGGAGLLFTGTTNTNHGAIQLAGGAVEFTAFLINSATGFIGGRGTLITGTGTSGGWLDNDGTLAFSGGFADVYGDVINDLGARIVTSGGGVTTFYDDVTHNGTEIRTASGSRSVFFGSVSGAGPFTGTGVAQMEGDLRPGNSTAAVTFGGDLEFGTLATLEIEIGGLIAGTEYDMLDIAGEASLDGALAVSLIGGFSPTIGNSFEVLRADGGIFGTFATTSLPALATGLDWNVVYSNFAVLLHVAAVGLPGDYNHNDVVDAADYVVWRKTLGQTGPGLAADGNSNGQIDAGDYDLWRARFGESAALSATAGPVSGAVVPEPHVLSLLMVGTWPLLRSPRCGKSGWSRADAARFVDHSRRTLLSCS